MTWHVSPDKYVTCFCGKVCKGKAAHANHARKCPAEIERTEALIEAVESGDYTRYNELTKGTRYELSQESQERIHSKFNPS